MHLDAVAAQMGRAACSRLRRFLPRNQDKNVLHVPRPVHWSSGATWSAMQGKQVLSAMCAFASAGNCAGIAWLHGLRPRAEPDDVAFLTAASLGQTGAVAALVRIDSDRRLNAHGALVLASQAGHDAVVQLLQECGASDLSGEALACAIAEGQLGAVQHLVRAKGKNASAIITAVDIGLYIACASTLGVLQWLQADHGLFSAQHGPAWRAAAHAVGLSGRTDILEWFASLDDTEQIFDWDRFTMCLSRDYRDMDEQEIEEESESLMRVLRWRTSDPKIG